MITWTDVAALDAQLASVPSAAQTASLADCYAMLPAARPVCRGAWLCLALPDHPRR